MAMFLLRPKFNISAGRQTHSVPLIIDYARPPTRLKHLFAGFPQLTASTTSKLVSRALA